MYLERYYKKLPCIFDYIFIWPRKFEFMDFEKIKYFHPRFFKSINIHFNCRPIARILKFLSFQVTKIENCTNIRTENGLSAIFPNQRNVINQNEIPLLLNWLIAPSISNPIVLKTIHSRSNEIKIFFSASRNFPKKYDNYRLPYFPNCVLLLNLSIESINSITLIFIFYSLHLDKMKWLDHFSINGKMLAMQPFSMRTRYKYFSIIFLYLYFVLACSIYFCQRVFDLQHYHTINAASEEYYFLL